MIRTQQINFDSYIDNDYDYSSDGETSEDMAISNQKTGNSKSFYISLDQHLENVNHGKNKYANELSSIAAYDEEDFSFDKKNRPFVPRCKKDLAAVDIVIFDIFNFVQFKITETNGFFEKYFLGWVKQCETPLNDYSSYLQSVYKDKYQMIRQMRCESMSISINDKKNQLRVIRHDDKHERILFHYVGFGFPKINDSNIYVMDQRTGRCAKYDVKSVFLNIGAPSFFVFDCDNAGILKDFIVEQEEILNKNSRNDYGFENSDYNDWFGFFATGIDESLPLDPLLPRDFLTSCLLTPVKISLICHIIRYYNTLFNDNDFPFSYLSKLKDKELNELELILNALIDSIASDCLNSKSFSYILRKDRSISILFRRFILAQYLLHFYDINPISHPALPNMYFHSFWNQWEFTLDTWVTSNLTPSISLLNNFINSITNSFSYCLLSNQTIKQSLLTAMCNISSLETKSSNHVFKLLAEFSAKDNENRDRVSKIIFFNSLFSKLISNKLEIEDFHSLTYLILSLIQYDLNFVFEVRKELDLSILLEYLFDESINYVTRSYIAAILSSILISVKSIQMLCSEKDFLINIKNEIPKAKPQLILWLFILLKRTFENTSIDMKLYYYDSIHYQVATCIFHQSYECRASAVTALSCFLQKEKNSINIYLLLFCLPCIFDVSFMVRYQLLFLIATFISSEFESLLDFKVENSTTFKSFSSIIDKLLFGKVEYMKIKDDFEVFAKSIDCFINESTIINNSTLIYFLLDYLSYDPHPTIKLNAIKIKRMFLKLIEDKEFRNYCSSSSPSNGSFNSYNSLNRYDNNSLKNDGVFDIEYSEQAEDNNNNNNTNNNIQTNLFISDFDSLYNVSLRQLIRTKQTNISSINKHSSKKEIEHMIFETQDNEIETPHLQLKGYSKLSYGKSSQQQINKLAFNKINSSIIVSSTNKWIYFLDDNLNTISKLRPSDSETSDLHYINHNGKLMGLICTSDGCIHLCNNNSKECSVSWRADSNYSLAKIPQYCTYLERTFQIISSRGSNSTILWDLNSQKLVNEWVTSNNINATSIESDINDGNICYIGYSNGEINLFDIRSNELIYKNSINTNLSGEIIKIHCNYENIYFATEKGVAIYDKRNNQFNNLHQESKSLFTHFSFQPKFSLFSSIANNEQPKLYDFSGNVIYDTTQLKKNFENSIFEFHSCLPIISFGSRNGEICSYNIISQ